MDFIPLSELLGPVYYNDGREYSYTTTEYGVLSHTDTTHTMTCGYLSDSQFDYARNFIKSTLKGYHKSISRLKVKCNNFEKSYKSYNRTFSDFNKYLSCVDNNSSLKIKKEDTSKMISIHQSNYLDHYIDYLKYIETMVKQVNSDLKKITKNDLYFKKSIVECDELVIRLSDETEKELNMIKDDIRIVGKYVNITNKIKIGLGLS